MNIVYILTNDSMPGLVKIGRTDSSIEERMKTLYSSGVPVPFECFHASSVVDAVDVERRIHNAFGKDRLNKNREFFEMAPENILEILEMVQIEDVTPREDFMETEDDKKAMEKLEKRKENFNFDMVEIKQGFELIFKDNEDKKCEVIGNNKVLYNNEEMSLATSALKVLHEIGKMWPSAQGTAHWMYEGETLKERRERMESE